MKRVVLFVFSTLTFFFFACGNSTGTSSPSGAQNDLVTAAVGIVQDATDNFSKVEVPLEGGAGAEMLAKKAALKSYIENLPDYAALGVSIEVSHLSGDEWTILIFNCCASTEKTIKSVSFTEAMFLKNIAAAKKLLGASLSFLKNISVTGGNDAELEAKKSAIAGNIEAIPSYKALKVTTTATPENESNVGSGSVWKITIAKGQLSDELALTVTAFVDSDELYDQALINGLSDQEYLLLVFGDHAVPVAGGDGASNDEKAAAIASFLSAYQAETVYSVVNISASRVDDNWEIAFFKGTKNGTAIIPYSSVTFVAP